MKNTRSYRFPALLLAVIMVIGLLPAATSAEVGTGVFSFSETYSPDVTDLVSFAYTTGGISVGTPGEMDPNKSNTLTVTANNASNAFARDSKGEMRVSVPANVIITKEDAANCQSEDVSCSYLASRKMLVFKWKGGAKDSFTATLPVQPDAPATKSDVSGTWVVAVKNKNSQLIVMKPETKDYSGTVRLTAVTASLSYGAIYRGGTDLPEWKITRYTGDWYSISCGGKYLNYGTQGGSVSLTGIPQYFLYTTVGSGNQFMAYGSDGSRYYLNNKSNNVNNGVGASTYDDQCVELYTELKSTDDTTLVKFSTNGGSAANGLDPVLIDKGSSVTLPEYSGTKNGYNFIGWATRSNIKVNTYTQIYQPGESVKVENETTFYATWSSKNPERTQFGIRMSGDIPDEPAQYDVGAYSKQHVYKDGAVKTGTWIVDTNAEGKPVDGNHVVNSVTANLTVLPNDEEIEVMYPGYDPETMYVHWYVLKYAGMWKVDGVIVYRDVQAEIRYDANVPTENKGSIKNIPATYRISDGSTVTVGAGSDGKVTKLPEYPDYIFEGWNTSEDGSGESFQSGDSYTVDGKVTFYAQWTRIPTYKVSYKNAEQETKEYRAGETVQIIAAEDRKDCLFGGWLINGVKAEGSEFTMPAEDVEISSVYYGPLDVSIVSDWPDEKTGYRGAIINLNAVVSIEGDLNLDYTFRWQYIGQDGEWVIVPGVTGDTISYELNEESSARVWRVFVTDAKPHQD